MMIETGRRVRREHRETGSSLTISEDSRRPQQTYGGDKAPPPGIELGNARPEFRAQRKPQDTIVQIDIICNYDRQNLSMGFADESA
jgi:hypothetical protein